MGQASSCSQHVLFLLTQLDSTRLSSCSVLYGDSMIIRPGLSSVVSEEFELAILAIEFA